VDTITRIVDLEAKRVVGSFTLPWPTRDQDGASFEHAGLFSADGKRYLMNDHKNRLHIFDIAAGKVTRIVELPGWGYGQTISPDGKLLISTINSSGAPEQTGRTKLDVSLFPQFRLITLEWQDPQAKPVVLIGPRGSAMSIAVRPDGKQLAVGATGGVHLFDLK